jgi:TIR domain
MHAQVFISHSGPDLPIARNLRGLLEHSGLASWLDSDTLPLGEGFVRQIGQAIRACGIFVLIDSDNARQSYWVGRELGAARRLRNARTGIELLRLGPETDSDPIDCDFSSPDPSALVHRCCEISALKIRVNNEYDTHRIRWQLGSGGHQPRMWIGHSDKLAFLDAWWLGSEPGVWISGPPACGKTSLAWTWLRSLEQIGFDRPESLYVWAWNRIDVHGEDDTIQDFLRIVHSRLRGLGQHHLIVVDDDMALHGPIFDFVWKARAANARTIVISTSPGVAGKQFLNLALSYLGEGEMNLLASQLKGRGGALSQHEIGAVGKLLQTYGRDTAIGIQLEKMLLRRFDLGRGRIL